MHAVIVAGGQVSDLEACRPVFEAPLVIAADGGLNVLHAADLRVPELVVGDLDSASAEAIAWATEHGAALATFDTEKDETDLELALDAALDRGASRVVIVAALGGRIDHELANVSLLASRRWFDQGLRVEAFDGLRRVWFVHDAVELNLPVGAPISLLPWHGDAAGVTSTGVRWPLRAETLGAGSPRGMSNVCTEPAQTVRVARGILLVVHDPSELDDGPNTDPSSGPRRAPLEDGR